MEFWFETALLAAALCFALRGVPFMKWQMQGGVRLASLQLSFLQDLEPFIS